MATIYMPLEDEGVDCWLAVKAEPTGDGTYRVIGPMGALDEKWRYPPGSVVTCEPTKFKDGTSGLVPVNLVGPDE